MTQDHLASRITSSWTSSCRRFTNLMIYVDVFLISFIKRVQDEK